MEYERIKNEILYAKIKKENKKKNKRFPLILGVNVLLTYTLIVLTIIFIL